MARYVTISCLSGPPAHVDPSTSLGAAVDQLVDQWRDRLELVLPDRPDLIVLPEMADCPDLAVFPIDRQRELLHYRGDLIRDFFAEVAAEHGCHIAYSAWRESSDGRVYNSTQLLDRSGAVAGTYDKNHVTIGENELYGVSYGTGHEVFDLDIGRVGCVICFDLNFDELRTAYQRERPELLVFSSFYHGGLMQQYWAYSCRAYLAASIRPPAPSGIVSPVGEQVATSTNYHDHVTATVNLDYAVLHLDGNRLTFPEVKRKYGPGVKIHDPGLLGSVLVTSETDDVTVADVVKEFDLEPLDDFFARSRRHRAAELD